MIPRQRGWLLPQPGPSTSCESRGSAGTHPAACLPGPALAVLRRTPAGGSLPQNPAGEGAGSGYRGRQSRLCWMRSQTAPVRPKQSPCRQTGQDSRAAARRALCFAPDRHSPSAAGQKVAGERLLRPGELSIPQQLGITPTFGAESPEPQEGPRTKLRSLPRATAGGGGRLPGALPCRSPQGAATTPNEAAEVIKAQSNPPADVTAEMESETTRHRLSHRELRFQIASPRNDRAPVPAPAEPCSLESSPLDPQ